MSGFEKPEEVDMSEWDHGREYERQQILTYIKDTQDNLRRVDSPVGSAQLAMGILYDEIFFNGHRDLTSRIAVATMG